MEYLDKYIPREYLALKINYCRQQLEKLPNAKVHDRMVNGSLIKKVIVDKHRYNIDSKIGSEYYQTAQLREELKRELELLESLWKSNIKTPVPSLLCKDSDRIILVGEDLPVVMDKEYFDSLKNDANDNYAKPAFYPFNGTFYRSAYEREIAIFYTEMGIPFKYEPEVYTRSVPDGSPLSYYSIKNPVPYDNDSVFAGDIDAIVFQNGDCRFCSTWSEAPAVAGKDTCQ